MTIFPGCKCCGPCWRCYKKNEEDPEYQCFDAPPDEEGWTPVGDCHATEEECAEECGWRCYEKLQDECCKTDTQGAGYQYAELIASDAIQPNDFSGLTLITDGKFQFVPGQTRTETPFAGCKTAMAEFVVGDPDVNIPAKAIGVYTNWLDRSPENQRGPLVYLRFNLGGGIGNPFSSYATWIKKATFAGKTIIGGEGCAGVFFFPDAKCDLPELRTYPPSDIGNDPQLYEIQETVPTESFTGLVEVEWLYQQRERDPNIPDSDYVIIFEDSGAFSFEWDQVVEMAACLPCGEDPDTPVEYQCFDAPPDEEGWQPFGEGHPDEESCDAACPSVPFCQCDGPNVLENELTVSFQNVNDSGYVPSDTENLTCSPEELFAQITSLSFNSPFLFFRYGGGPTPPPECVDFDEAAWGSESNDPRDVMQASVMCVNYGGGLINPIRCEIEETFPPSCLKQFTKDGVEWTPKGIRLSAGGVSWGNVAPPGDLCEFANTGTIVSEYSKLDQPDPFTIGGFWENLNYTGDEAQGPQYYSVLVSIFTADFLLTVNSTLPPGGRTMPTTKTIGPGTHLKNMLSWFNIKAKEKGCGCKSMEKKMNKNGPQWCRDHKQEILDHLAKEAKKRKLPFIRLAAEKMVDLAIRKAEKDST